MIAGKILSGLLPRLNLYLVLRHFRTTIDPLKRIETRHHRPERGLNILFPGG